MYLFGAPWLVGYFVPWAVAVVGLLVVAIVVAIVASSDVRARVNRAGGVGIAIFLWIAGGVAHGSSLRADADREKSEREAQYALALSAARLKP